MEPRKYICDDIDPLIEMPRDLSSRLSQTNIDLCCTADGNQIVTSYCIGNWYLALHQPLPLTSTMKPPRAKYRSTYTHNSLKLTDMIRRWMELKGRKLIFVLLDSYFLQL